MLESATYRNLLLKRTSVFVSIILFVFVFTPGTASAQTFDIYEGVVSLPNDVLATGEEQITITARSLEFFPTNLEFMVVVPEGANEGPFSFLLDRNDAPVFWTLRISCQGCDEDVSDQVHFATTEIANPLSLDIGDNFNFAVGQDFRDLRFTFISTRPTNVNPVRAGQLIPSIDLLLNSD